ncbi:MAG: UDP-galactopyranose mutase [bacterium]
MNYDYLIVGAGLAGSVLAERLADIGKQVLLVEQRDHLGGNCYDSINQDGILIHNYGPHIFHTNDQVVWDYLSKFTAWHPYSHRVLANFNGQVLTLPPNLNTFEELFPGQEISKTMDKFEQEIDKKIFMEYSRKQWGTDLSELAPEVRARIPIRLDRDNRYFKDKYQGIPKDGYSKLFKRMLANKNIEVVLGKDYKEIVDTVSYCRMIYTGPIDHYFDYQYGPLPYRSADFQFQTLDQQSFQPAPVVNYTGAEPYTRITEFKKLTGQKRNKTTILREFPQAYQPGKNIPCYPIPQEQNQLLNQKYQQLAEQESDTIFIGRLAEYRYYNMDGVVGRALEIFGSLA